MATGIPPCPAGADSDSLLIELEDLLGREEAVLSDLERLVSEKRKMLFAPEPRSLLDVLQAAEEVVGRIARLESARDRLMRLMASAAGGPDSGSSSPGTTGAVTSPRLIALRHRILGLIARIAEQDEMNIHLVAGLSRVGGAKLDTLGRLDPEVRRQTGLSNRRPAERKLSSFDIQA